MVGLGKARFSVRALVGAVASAALVVTGLIPAEAVAPLGNSTFLAQTQTQNLSGINGGAGSSYMAQSVVLNDKVYYIGNGPTTGPELYTTDGTAAGTNLVKDVYPGGSGTANYLAKSNGKLFFSSSGTSGYEPYISDGTAAGTLLLKDIRASGGSSSPSGFVEGPNGLTYFLAYDGTTSLNAVGNPIDNGQELWLTDGTAAGTSKVIDMNTYNYLHSNGYYYNADSYIRNLTSCNGKMYFAATQSGVYNANELYATDGTTAGTYQVKDINPATQQSNFNLYSQSLNSTITSSTMVPAGSDPQNLTCVNNTLYFSAHDGSGIHLWKSDGTDAGTVKVRPVTSGNYPYDLSNFVAFGNKLVFAAVDSNGTGNEIWISDGTSAGTTLLKDINAGPTNSDPNNLVVYNGNVFFVATDARGAELWKTDGTTVGTLFVKDINAVGSGTSSSPKNMYVWNNKLFFTANNGISGREFYVSGGTGVTTNLVKDIFPGISDILDTSNNSYNVPYFAGTSNSLVFTANSPIYGQEMWFSDGTESGTQLLQDLNPNPGYAYTHDAIAFNGKIYFSAASAYFGQELWSTDLTTGNTQQVIDIFPGASSGMDSSKSYFTIFNGRLFFSARNATTGYELWSTDGTAAGTKNESDLYPGYGYNSTWISPTYLTVCDGKLYFGQYSSGGYTVQKFDGVNAPVPVVNFNLFPENLVCLNNIVYFSGQHPTTYDQEFWRTDGTSAGTALVYDADTATYSSGQGYNGSVRNLTVYNGKVYFTAYNTVTGWQLYGSDGTTAGTQMVQVNTGNASSNPSQLMVFNNELWFKANVGSNGSDMYSYDGTTVTPRDFAAGTAALNIQDRMVIAGGLIWYSSNNTDGKGYELSSSDGTTANSGIFEDLSPNSASTTISNLTAVGGVLIYNTYDSVMGSQPRFVVVSTITTVTFNSNGATSGSAPSEISVMAINATIPGNTGAMVKTGYNFTGWNTSATGTGTKYLPGSTITPIVDTPLYAMWASVTAYTITYDANGATSGVVAPPLTGVTSMVNLDTNSGAMAKTGYAFAGWATQANGGGLNYASGARYTPTADITLYAKWTALTPYSISFNLNTATGTAPTQINTYATAIVTLPGQGSMIAPSGKTFAGWNTNAAGTGSAYAAAETLSPQSNMTLYAQWTVTPSSTLTYDANGSTSGSVPTALTATGTYVVIDSNTGSLFKTGYVFAGWNTQTDGLGTTYQGTDNYLLNADVTLYAKWDVASYSVTFSGNGSTSGTAPATVTGIAVSTVLPGNTGTLAKAGYTFSGWNTLPSGLGTTYAVGDTFSPTVNTTLYAKWTALPTYTVGYDANGATGGGAPVAQSGVYSAVTLDNNSGALAKTSYYFAGWNTLADGTGTNYAAGSSYTPTANITLFAKWSANPTYTVTYFGNSNTSGTVPLPQTGISTSATVSGNSGSLARLGYRFDGWNTLADGTGTDYVASDTVTPTANVSLYAQWVAVPTYTITYNGNSQTSGSVPSPITSSDANVTLSGNTGVLNRTNYTFTGWNTLADGTGTHYDVGASFPLTANVTLYAEWLGNSYTITYNTNGADSGTAPAATTGRGAQISATNSGNLIKAGYTFGGWNTAGDGSSTTVAVNSSYTPSGNVTLFAKWNAIVSYTITYNGNTNTSGSAPTATSSYSSQTVAAAGTLAKANYGFTGWNTAANGSGTRYAAGATYSATANVTLYAQWSALADLNYDANTADSGSAPSSVIGVVSTTASAAGSLAKAGYSFSGWNTAANGSGTAYAAGATVNLSVNTTLYAQWSISSFSVSYQANGATSGSAPAMGTSGTGSISLSANSGLLKRDGYDFSGWNTLADGTGSNFAPGTVMALNANTVLYANWKIATPPPKFNVASLSKRKMDTAGGSLEVTGTDLTLVDYVALDGDKLTVAYSSDSKIVLVITSQAVGKKDLVFESSNQKWTYQDAIEFIAPTAKLVANVKTKDGKVSADAVNQILLEARRHKIYTDVQLSFVESATSAAKVGEVSALDNLQLLLLARQIVNLVNHQVGVSVQVKANISQIVLTFSVK